MFRIVGLILALTRRVVTRGPYFPERLKLRIFKTEFSYNTPILISDRRSLQIQFLRSFNLNNPYGTYRVNRPQYKNLTHPTLLK